MKYKLVAQEESMGCAVASIASLLGVSYKKSLKLFNRKSAITPNFYCSELVRILSNSNLKYNYSKIRPLTKKYLKIPGTVVFIKRSKKHPVGHYLLRTERGWMNPWVNLPDEPIRAGFQKKLPGKAQWVIYKI